MHFRIRRIGRNVYIIFSIAKIAELRGTHINNLNI